VLTGNIRISLLSQVACHGEAVAAAYTGHAKRSGIEREDKKGRVAGPDEKRGEGGGRCDSQECGLRCGRDRWGRGIFIV
jgi:hypothetical protein